MDVFNLSCMRLNLLTVWSIKLWRINYIICIIEAKKRSYLVY